MARALRRRPHPLSLPARGGGRPTRRAHRQQLRLARPYRAGDPCSELSPLRSTSSPLRGEGFHPVTPDPAQDVRFMQMALAIGRRRARQYLAEPGGGLRVIVRDEGAGLVVVARGWTQLGGRPPRRDPRPGAGRRAGARGHRLCDAWSLARITAAPDPAPTPWRAPASPASSGDPRSRSARAGAASPCARPMASPSPSRVCEDAARDAHLGHSAASPAAGRR